MATNLSCRGGDATAARNIIAAMAAAAFDALAAELIGLHEAPRQVAPFSERFAQLTPEAGYRAARHLHAHRLSQGWRPRGRKIGFTNRTLWPRYGVFEPMWGWVYEQTLVLAQGDRARVSLAGLVQPRIEPEIAFKLKAPPPRTRDPEKLLAAIECVAHAVEIVQCHHPDWKVTIADCCADNGLHGRLVVGTPMRVEEIPDLAAALPAAAVTLKKGALTVDRGVGANVLDSPLMALAFLVEVLAAQPDVPPLAAGEIISTGVLTDAHPVAAGETWSTSFAGLPLPGLTLEFT
jgi:2-oxo-3-hexenedioate decarboxylase